jgi:hypothetical protein
VHGIALFDCRIQTTVAGYVIKTLPLTLDALLLARSARESVAKRGFSGKLTARRPREPGWRLRARGHEMLVAGAEEFLSRDLPPSVLRNAATSHPVGPPGQGRR